MKNLMKMRLQNWSIGLGMASWPVVFALLVMGCASMERGCASGCASTVGSDWLVVRYTMSGEPVACWQLHDAVVTSETGSDGVWWQDRESGHLVHIGGWYDHVQVKGGDFARAASNLGVDIRGCVGGRYAWPATVLSRIDGGE